MIVVKYEKICQSLREEIMAERFSNGKLPPLSMLSCLYQANPATVSKAIKQLEAEGLVQCGPGSTGTFIDIDKVRRLQKQQLFSRSNFHHKPVLLRYSAPSGTIELYQSLIDDFQNLYPSIAVDLLDSSEEELFDGANHEFDVIQFAMRNLSLLKKHNRLLDLTEFNDKLPIEENRLGLATADNLAVPFFINTPVMLINADKIDPTWKGNWNELEILARDGRMTLNLGPLPFLSCWVGQPREQFSRTENHERLLRAFKLLLLLQSTGAEVGGCRIPKEFICGDSIAFLTMSSYLRDIPKGLSFRYRVLTVPRFDEHAIISELSLNAINCNSRHPVESYLLIRYLSSFRAQQKLAQYKFAIPINIEAFATYKQQTNSEFSYDEITSGSLSCFLSYFAMLDFEYYNASIIKRGLVDGTDYVKVVSQMQRHFAEYAALEDLR